MLTLYYDETCVLCTTNALSMQSKKPTQIEIKPVFESEKELAQFGISIEQAMTYVCVYESETCSMHKGMPAVRVLFSTARVRYASLLYLPIVNKVCDVLYPILARNRYYFPNWLTSLLYGKTFLNDARSASCNNGLCKIPPQKRSLHDQK